MFSGEGVAGERPSWRDEPKSRVRSTGGPNQLHRRAAGTESRCGTYTVPGDRSLAAARTFTLGPSLEPPSRAVFKMRDGGAAAVNATTWWDRINAAA